VISKIKYIVGDLFAGPEKVLLHGCNAKGAFGSGVAKIVRDRFPLAYHEYLNQFRNGGLILGSVIWSNCGKRVIGNAITQSSYGRDGAVYVDYGAVRAVMTEVDTYCARTGTEAVGLPMIGAGLGGGDWKIIAAIIEDEAKCFQPVVYAVDPAMIPS
jgi:O-acetyl-ADP-ribose deacetylase (regulator of RNase III)